MLGPFATASRFTLPFTRCRYTPPAHRCLQQDDNDNAWQRGPLWPHGMGPITHVYHIFGDIHRLSTRLSSIDASVPLEQWATRFLHLWWSLASLAVMLHFGRHSRWQPVCCLLRVCVCVCERVAVLRACVVAGGRLRVSRAAQSRDDRRQRPVRRAWRRRRQRRSLSHCRPTATRSSHRPAPVTDLHPQPQDQQPRPPTCFTPYRADRWMTTTTTTTMTSCHSPSRWAAVYWRQSPRADCAQSNDRRWWPTQSDAASLATRVLHGGRNYQPWPPGPMPHTTPLSSQLHHSYTTFTVGHCVNNCRPQILFMQHLQSPAVRHVHRLPSQCRPKQRSAWLPAECRVWSRNASAFCSLLNKR